MSKISDTPVGASNKESTQIRAIRQLVQAGTVNAYKKRRDAERHDAIVRMARMEMEAGTYDKVVLPEGAEER